MFAALRTIFMGLLGYCAPRVAKAMGIPLDEWSAHAGAWVIEFYNPGAAMTVHPDVALSWLGFIFALMMVFAELWWHPAGKLVSKLRDKFTLGKSRLGSSPLGGPHDINMEEAIYYISCKKWGGPPQDWYNIATISDVMKLLNNLRQAASDELVTVWGKKSLQEPFTKIPADYWTNYGFDIVSITSEDPSDWRTEQKTFTDQNAIYRDLRLTSEEIRKHF